MKKICLSTGLVKKNGQKKTVDHNGELNYILETRSDDWIMEQRLIPITTEPKIIRQAIQEIAERNQSILEFAKSSAIITMNEASNISATSKTAAREDFEKMFGKCKTTDNGDGTYTHKFG